MNHKLYIYNGEKANLIEKAWYQSEFYKEFSKKLVSLRLFPTLIHVVVKPPRHQGKKLGGKISFPKTQFLRETNQTEETKKMFDESYDASDAGGGH